MYDICFRHYGEQDYEHIYVTNFELMNKVFDSLKTTPSMVSLAVYETKGDIKTSGTPLKGYIHC